MKTAVITGASSGLGMEFVSAAAELFPEIEQFWLVARRTDRLKTAAKALPAGKSVLLLAADLSAEDGYLAYEQALLKHKPQISLLINAAGLGFLGNVAESPWRDQAQMVDVNTRGLTVVTTLSLPYMGKGSKIVNISSIASFCPNARMTVYSSTKAYVSSFTRGLAEEVRPAGISVTAVCPGPMSTEFLAVGNITGNSKMFATLPYDVPKKVAYGALKAAKKGRVFYTPHPFFKCYRVLAKLLPHALVAKLCKT